MFNIVVFRKQSWSHYLLSSWTINGFTFAYSFQRMTVKLQLNMSFLNLDILLRVDYYINFIFAGLLCGIRPKYKFWKRNSGYINIQIWIYLYYFKHFYFRETFKRKRWYVVEEEQQTINVGILNAFFVQYHLTIGQTPYVQRSVIEELLISKIHDMTTENTNNICQFSKMFIS